MGQENEIDSEFGQLCFQCLKPIEYCIGHDGEDEEDCFYCGRDRDHCTCYGG